MSVLGERERICCEKPRLRAVSKSDALTGRLGPLHESHSGSVLSDELQMHA